ncbi:MAG: DUF2891 domain-containing protein [Proteobacteria bacterium]|nr:DUF2891 domain-containing protein [Pseudomonadota bacterium]
MTLTPDVAARLAALPLHCIPQQYPNKTGHTVVADADARLSPRELHPVFYGCFDWHSAVHGHWMLVRLLKTNALPAGDAAAVQALLTASLTPAGLQAEADYFSRYPGARIWERAYGWAWLLKLDAELATWDAPHAQRWHAALQPLTRTLVGLWMDWLPKQTYPNRTGIHPNSGFAMAFGLDWARAMGAADFEAALVAKARAFHLGDRAMPVHLEPDGNDFFSPSLEVAELMARVLAAPEFAAWWAAFMPAGGIAHLAAMPHISDLADYQTVHLVGLALSRAWAMRHVAAALGSAHPQHAELSRSADTLLAAGLPLVFAGDYGGDHWLATFAVHAMAQGSGSA